MFHAIQKKKETSRSYSILKQYAWADVINDAFINKRSYLVIIFIRGQKLVWILITQNVL